VSFSGKIRRFRAGIDISGEAPADPERESDHERMVRVFSVAGERIEQIDDMSGKIETGD